MKRIPDFLARLLLGLLLGGLGSAALAIDEILEVEIHNATSAAISPGKDFSWLDNTQATGHDFVIEPGHSQELTYYLPQSRGNESFSYQQGERVCGFGFSHVEPGSANINRRVYAKSMGQVASVCGADLIAITDDDDFVSNGGSRVLFTMK